MPNLSIFQGISQENRQSLFHCLHPWEHSYQTGEVIMTYTDSTDRLGVILQGKALLYCLDSEGRQNVLEQLEQDALFGEQFLFPARHAEYYVEATVRTQVLFFHYQDLIKRCSNACPYHSQLMSNLFQLIARKAQAQAAHINVLSQRTVQLKLLTYFETLCQQSGGQSCTLPMSYSALAEYICSDRSAMMRELKRLREEGRIETKGRQVRLLDLPAPRRS